ncbi:junctional adhesion molecule A-like [Salvelinus fontinalis]|uniref:junctional adhesion molecule A-like n=1 Tax=Salvelinus fontinalis TaxID=8038 RepID=UPI0024858F1F|nr:junctional adhesion molecule A-like [Salvelinus fontinalis]
MRCPVPSVTQVTEMVWYNKRLNGKPYDLRWDPNYEGRVEYRGTTEKDCILRITDLRESDVATYYFRYKTNQYSEWKYSYGFPLSLTDLKVERIYDNKLTCNTTCTLTGNPTYIWYKNRQHLDERTSPQYKDPVSSNYVDSYSCAVKGHEDLRSPAVYILLEMDPTSVSEGERVTLRCRTKCTVALNPTYIWYKNGQHLTNTITSYNSLILNPVTSYNSLILDPVSSEDAGNYSCAVKGFERILSPEETLTVRCE